MPQSTCSAQARSAHVVRRPRKTCGSWPGLILSLDALVCTCEPVDMGGEITWQARGEGQVGRHPATARAGCGGSCGRDGLQLITLPWCKLA